MYNTQCIFVSIYIGDIHCVTIFLATVYTLGDSIYIVVQVDFCNPMYILCYPMYIRYIHWGTRIYIVTHVYTFGNMYIHWVTCIYIHCVTLATRIYIG